MPLSFIRARLPERGAEALIRGSVWAFIGMLFGSLYAFGMVFVEPASPLPAGFLSGTLAAALCALIYGSMRLAMIVASAASAMCALLFVGLQGAVPLALLGGLVLPVGALIGALYGALMRPTSRFGSDVSRVFRADAKAAAGLAAGAAAACMVLLLQGVSGPLAPSLGVALLVAASGFLYVHLVPGCVARWSGMLPPAGDGALVGLATAGFVTSLMLALVSGSEPRLVGELAGPLAEVRRLLPDALTGGLVGGGAAGVVGGLLLTRWQDL
jgi:hypothetical protein